MVNLYDDKGRHVASLFDDGGDEPLQLLESLSPCIPHSVYDADQRFLGTINTGHVWLPCEPSHVGEDCVSWDEEIAEKDVIGTIHWDGACKVQITGWWESKVVQGPRGKVFPWPQAKQEEGADAAQAA